MLLMIDNYDSFTYNLVQYFAELGQEVVVRRNDDISLAEIRNEQYLKLIQNNIMKTINEITDVGGFDFGTVVMKNINYIETWSERSPSDMLSMNLR